MPDTSVQHSKSFDDNLDILFDEIMLAEQWGRPSLLLAVHKSRFGQEKAEAQLEDRLRAEGFHVQRIAFNDQRSDIALLLNEAQSSTKPVYYISNLDWGGGDDQRDAYRGLNLHREMFVEGAVRAVFWLTANEAANLPRYAPDFWAFRHRVVEFISQRATGKVRLPAGILVWDVQQSLSAFESTEASIRAREELLRKLPDSPEALAARVELHAGLGFLHWCLGSLSKAADELQAGLVLAGEHALPELKASLLNGLGIIRYEMGDFGAALDKFQEGLRFRSSSRALWINASAANCMMGRIQEALKIGMKALKANPSDADTWSRVGYIQNAAGRTDEGLKSIASASQLAPRSIEHPIALAVMYALVDRSDETRSHFARAQELAGGEVPALFPILHGAALGDTDRARQELKALIDSGKLLRQEARRDVNLSLLFEETQLEELIA